MRWFLLPLIVPICLFLLDFLFSPQYIVYDKGIVLVTGASSGIGKDAVIELEKIGYTVFAGVRNENDAAGIVALNKPNLLPLFIDVSDKTSIHEAFLMVQQKMFETSLPFVGLVNNAGVSGSAPLELVPASLFDNIFKVNVFGVHDCTQKFLPLIRASKGRVINIGSVAGLMAVPMHGTYAASKHALEGYTDVLRRELASFQVSVSLVDPAYIKTSIQEKSNVATNAIFQELQLNNPTLYTEYKTMLDAFLLKRNAGFAKGDEVSVSSEAILDALRNPSPKTRYFVANANGVPAWVIPRLKSILPDRVLDALLVKLGLSPLVQSV